MDEISIDLLKLVNADKNQDVRLTLVESFVLSISSSWITLLKAPIGVQNGWKFNQSVLISLNAPIDSIACTYHSHG